MIGRATRRCDEIGKTVFKIYDPVDIYAALQAVNTMQPLVKDPNVTLEQLLDELNNPASFEAPGSAPDRSHAHDVLDQLNQKLMRVLRERHAQGRQAARAQARLDELEQQWGVPPAICTSTCTSWAECAADWPEAQHTTLARSVGRGTADARHRVHAHHLRARRRAARPRTELGRITQARGLPRQLQPLRARSSSTSRPPSPPW